MQYDFNNEVKTYQRKANKLNIQGVSHCNNHNQPTGECDDCEFRLDSAIRRIQFVEQRA